MRKVSLLLSALLLGIARLISSSIEQDQSLATASITLLPACPCYHAVDLGNGDTLVTVRLNATPSQRVGLRVSAELTDREGRRIQSAMADIATGPFTSLTLRVPVQTAGSYVIIARLLDASSREIAQAKTDVHVIPHNESRVQVGPDGFLQVGGKPHFPIGMYSCGHYEEMGRAGFSVTHNYGITTGEATESINPNDTHLKQLLDNSYSNGMRMMVELPRKAIEKAQWTQVRRRIETFRHHPGLLCWGSEERVARGTAPLTNVAMLYHLVRALDPDHPLVLGDTKDVIKKFQHDRRDFFPDDCMDIGIWWWYPIPLKEPDGNGVDGRDGPGTLLQPPSWLTTTISKKPLWIAIQSYQHPTKDGRFPTPAEYRCMAYLSILNGAKGLFFYTGSGQKDYQGKPAGLLNKPEEGHWDYVQKLVTELRQFSPVIMGTAIPPRLTIVPADAPVEFALREHEGRRYLIAANKSGHPQTVTFKGPWLQGKGAEVLFEMAQPRLTQDSLADDFPPFAVHIYKLQ